VEALQGKKEVENHTIAKIGSLKDGSLSNGVDKSQLKIK